MGEMLRSGFRLNPAVVNTNPNPTLNPNPIPDPNPTLIPDPNPPPTLKVWRMLVSAAHTKRSSLLRKKARQAQSTKSSQRDSARVRNKQQRRRR